jgi:hypothetical protein
MPAVRTLDDLIPSPHWRTRHARRVTVAPERAIAAAREVTLREMPLVALLIALRGLGSRRGSDVPLTQRLERGIGLTEVGENVWAGIQRPWKPRGEKRRVVDVAAFDEPGWVKLGVDLRAADGVLATETRIVATDDEARRRFARYWLVVRPGSDLIRIAWLRAAERRALRA